jgi:hypothetical protein
LPKDVAKILSEKSKNAKLKKKEESRREKV